MLRSAPAVQFTKHQITLYRTCVSGNPRNREQGFQQLIWVLPTCSSAAPVAYNFGIRLLSEDFLPYFEISRNVQIPVRLPTNTRHQQHNHRFVPEPPPSRIRHAFSSE